MPTEEKDPHQMVKLLITIIAGVILTPVAAGRQGADSTSLTFEPTAHA